ncbi:modular serine protease-like [Photinus pyralis]|nr:modular serine protease-like [Photinus pyralis]
MLLFLVFLTCSYLFANFANGGTYAENYSEFRRTRFCNESSFRCDSGECITEDHLCDGTVHCRDGSDETRDCFNIIPCASDLLFQCDYGACINKARQCDGTPDCKDKSDETALACKKCG